MKRREFLRNSVESVIALSAASLVSARCTSTQQSTDKDAPRLVPDTLDFVDMAHLGLNSLTGLVDPDHEYEAYVWSRFNSPEPYMIHAKFAFDCQGKWWESFPYLRSITNSDVNREIEEGFTRSMLNRVAQDGLFYSGLPRMSAWHEVNAGGQWHTYKVHGEPFSNILGNARNMLAMMAYYQQDGNEDWLKQLQATSDGLVGIAQIADDYAYYPDGSVGTAFSHPLSGWKNTTEPSGERYGGEGSVLCYYGQVIRALARWHTASGDEMAIEMAGRLVNFCQKPKLWQWQKFDAKPKDIVVEEHACFLGHFHGHLAYLRGLLEYAMATDNWRLKEFVRSGYEYARKKGLARIGCFGEGCAGADMIALGIRLSDTGIGDYWDDVSQYLRNQFVEMQFSSLEKLRAISARAKEKPRDSWDLPIPGLKSTDRILERSLGSFSSGATPVHANPYMLICCEGNCTNAIYYAWESILRQRGDSVQLNLLMNRTSEAIDVESYLPYEGRVLLRNRGARSVSLRIPVWVNRRQLRIRINDGESEPAWVGNYATLTGLKPGDVITGEFPLREESVTYHLDTEWWYRYYDESYRPKPKEFVCDFKGDSCIGVEGPVLDPGAYMLYERDHLKQTETPMKQIAWHMPDKIFTW